MGEYTPISEETAAYSIKGKESELATKPVIHLHHSDFDLEYTPQPRERRIRKGDKSTPVDGKTSDIIRVLITKKGHVVPHSVLIDEVWNGVVVSDQDHLIRTYVGRARRKLKSIDVDPGIIKTHWGIGISLEDKETQPQNDVQQEDNFSSFPFNSETNMVTLENGSQVLLTPILARFFSILNINPNFEVPVDVLAMYAWGIYSGSSVERNKFNVSLHRLNTSLGFNDANYQGDLSITATKKKGNVVFKDPSKPIPTELRMPDK